MTHLVCWYPTIDDSEKLFEILSKYSEFIEIQFPFSDPIADWPLISSANEKALANWITTSWCFDFIERNINKSNSKILIMTYYNIIYNYWVQEFVVKAKGLGIYWFIIPDVPFDEIEWQELIDLCKKEWINLIQIVSPACEKERLEKIFSIASGFVYAVSQNMTTWSKATFWDWFKKYIEALRKYSPIDIGVWFWIKTSEDVQEVCEVADFAIIWSEIIKVFKESWLEWVDRFFSNL